MSNPATIKVHKEVAKKIAEIDNEINQLNVEVQSKTKVRNDIVMSYLYGNGIEIEQERPVIKLEVIRGEMHIILGLTVDDIKRGLSALPHPNGAAVSQE